MKIPTANFTASICATSTLFIVAIVLACVVAVGAFIYGVIRRLSRMSWAGLQIPVIFGLTMLLRFVPAAMGSSLRFSITVGGFFAITVCVLGLGALVFSRDAMNMTAVYIFAGLGVTGFVGNAVLALLRVLVEKIEKDGRP